MSKKIIFAKKYGFCFGVRRAIDVLDISSGTMYTLGPIIHNPQVVDHYLKKGIKSIDSLDEINSGTVFIRAHGVPDKIINQAKEKNLEVIDLTCPYVKKTQILAKELEKDGYQVVILGQKNHPEVIAIASNLKRPVVVESVHNLREIKNDKIGVICQTTSNIKKADKLISKLKNDFKEVKVYNTICNATHLRQEAVKELAQQSDVVIVIGGKKSSNTKKLKEVAEKIIKTYHIETEDELQKEWFIDKNTIGITAGASTPNWIIKKVAEKIDHLIK